GHASLNSSIRVAAGRPAAESSNRSRNFPHSSSFFFSRLHMPASLRSCLGHQSTRFFARLTTRRRARKSLTFTVLPFRFKTSAISSIENPSTSFRISISRSLSRSEEHTSELQSPYDLVCRLLLEKKKL